MNWRWATLFDEEQHTLLCKIVMESMNPKEDSKTLELKKCILKTLNMRKDLFINEAHETPNDMR